MIKKKKCAIFYVSDGTAITAETVGRSLITQFDDIEFIEKRLAFINDVETAQMAAKIIKDTSSDYQPLVINTVVDIELRKIIHSAGGLKLDPFNRLLRRIERNLQIKAKPVVGRAHGMSDSYAYNKRIEATNFALSHDDGMNLNLEKADLILLGVSRSGKTPTCLYLALHYGLKAANYPITDEDLDRMQLPAEVMQYKDKLFGLTIDPFRLSQIRSERRPNSRYAELRKCQMEVSDAEVMFHRNQISFLNTTLTSIEEISGKILIALDLNKRLY
ncbi:MAG: pyruvate, water dikinase regulatory protein [Marinicella sp.]